MLDCEERGASGAEPVERRGGGALFVAVTSSWILHRLIAGQEDVKNCDIRIEENIKVGIILCKVGIILDLEMGVARNL